MARDAQKTRNRILSAANRLFYSDGIRAVSVDAVAQKANVTKMTLYYHFRSKDDLITAYLQSRDQPNLTLFEKWFDETNGPLANKVEAIFTNLSKSARQPKWRGCGFLRTVAELANKPGHPAVKVGAAHKKKFEAWLCKVIDRAELEQAAMLARQIVLLMDGAFSLMLVHRDPEYIEAAGSAAVALINSATEKSK